ncbi:MAG: heptaprenylglyceryl phosphate synthase [Halobacteriales archaeon]
MGTVDDLARTLGDLVAAAHIGAGTLGIDTNPVPEAWEHITKVDPEHDKELPLLYPLYLRHTSAVSVGGSRDVTGGNTEETFELLDRAPVPAFQEPSSPRHVTDRTRELSDFLAIPEVLNGDIESLIGDLGEGAAYMREELVPGMIDDAAPWLPRGLRGRLADAVTTWLLASAVFEAYIIQNEESAAAREAGVTGEDRLDAETAATRALAAEKHLHSEVIYVEYSGRFGGEEAVDLVAAIDEATGWPRLWYGGGLDNQENTETVLEAGADAVVVGNAFHEVAVEERELCSRVVEDLDPDADAGALRGWLDSALDVADAAATRYLATVPGVDDPEATAREYLTETLRARLDMAALAGGATEDGVSTGADAAAFVADREAGDLPGGTTLQGAAGTDGVDLARAYAEAHLRDALDADPLGEPLGHVSLFEA